MPGTSNDGYYDVLWPRSPRQFQLKPLATRLASLNSRRTTEASMFAIGAVRAGYSGELVNAAGEAAAAVATIAGELAA